MKVAALRAGIFSFTAFVALLVLDLVLWGVWQGAEPHEQRAQLMGIHAVFHAAVLSLSALGAGIGFLLLRERVPSTRQAAFVGLAFAAVSVLLGPGSFMLAGVWGAAFWLFFGAVAMALGSGLLGWRTRGA